MMATINQLKRRRLGFSEVCLLVCCADLKREENIKGSYQSLSATPFGGAGNIFWLAVKIVLMPISGVVFSFSFIDVC
jgi:hypothetical protein